MLRSVVLSGRGSEPLGRIWGFLGPKRRAPTLGDQRGGQASSRSKVGRGGSSRQLEDSSVGPSF